MRSRNTQRDFTKAAQKLCYTNHSCKAIVSRNVRSFKVDDTVAEDTRTIACLSLYFNLGNSHSLARNQREAVFFSLMIAESAIRRELPPSITSKCRYCGSTAYGNSCPNGVHVHIDTDANCEYCGYSSYGKSCSFAPRGIHRHGHGNGKCIWCGYNLSGKGCSFAPNGVHEK